MTALAEASRRLSPRLPSSEALARALPGLIVVVSIAYFGTRRPEIFFSSGNLGNYLVSLSVLGVLTMGLTLVLQSGEFDLAFPNVLVMSGMLTGLLVESVGSVPAALLAVGAGAAVGTVSGVLVVYLRVNSFVGTLGVGTVVSGAVLALNEGQSVSLGGHELFRTIGQDSLLGVSLLFWAFAVVALAAYLVARRTPLGRRIEAAGANPAAARLMGVDVGRVKVLALVLGGALAAVAGLMLASRLGALSPAAGPPFLFQVYSVVFLGAVMDSDGRFTIGGTLFGLLAISLLNNGLTVIGVNVLTQSIATGAVLLAAVFLARRQASSAVVGR